MCLCVHSCVGYVRLNNNVHKRPLLNNIDRILSTLLIILVSPANDVCHQLISLATMLGLSFKNCVL
jgi:hypothetical protein